VTATAAYGILKLPPIAYLDPGPARKLGHPPVAVDLGYLR